MSRGTTTTLSRTTSSSPSPSPILPDDEALDVPSEDLPPSASFEDFDADNDECTPNRFDFKADRAISANGLNAFKNAPSLKYFSPDSVALFGPFCSPSPGAAYLMLVRDLDAAEEDEMVDIRSAFD